MGEAMAQASAKYGSLSSQWDLVMFCQPPGSGTWLAYVFINSWVSFYNDKWCQSVSAQIHEVGHNLGLGHSNQGTTAYGDQSSLMGYSYDSDDGPKMCFNAAKNFQLGWYERQKVSFYPLSNKDTTQSFVLNGVDDYNKDGSSNGELITLRIVEYGDEYDSDLGNYGNDYYVGYNRKTGPNSGTLEAGNQVVVFRKDTGGPDGYGESNRVADLNAGDSFKIENFKGKPFDVTIRVKSITNNGRDANIEITTLGDGVPTMTPTTSCGGTGRFQIELNIDSYAFETAWELIENESDEVIASAPKENHLSKQKYTYPTDGSDYYCLEEEKCYTFKITDTWGDGLNYGEGSYVGYLDDEIEFEGDSDFTFEETHQFCVGSADQQTSAPVPAPTKAPTKKPTETPTKSPTKAPTKSPTKTPTKSPTYKPTKSPTNIPTKNPTKSPTDSPTKKTTNSLTKAPINSTTNTPTESPTKAPSNSPTNTPTESPTKTPTAAPSDSPTKKPTKSPTQSPTVVPTDSPTKEPTASPTKAPINSPTNTPTKPPTKAPTEPPTKKPTRSPTQSPTTVPSNNTSCDDQSDFLLKGRAKKDCNWAGKGNEKKIENKCKKNNGDGKKVRDYCPKTCAKVNQGPCAELIL